MVFIVFINFSVNVLGAKNTTSIDSKLTTNNEVVDENEFYDLFINHQYLIDDYNLSVANDAYTEDNEKVLWLPASVEYASKIDVCNSDEKVMYLDLNEENGFIVVDSNDVLVEFNTNSDLAFLRESNNFYYSFSDSFVTYNENTGGFDQIYVDDFSSVDFFNEEVSNTPVQHNGQASSGDGEIYDIDAYIADRYGSNYIYVSGNYIQDYDWIYQYDTSVYEMKLVNPDDQTDVLFASEGNCVINASYSLLSNLPYTNNYQYYSYFSNLRFGLRDSNYMNEISTDPLLYMTYSSYSATYEMNGIDYDETWLLNGSSIIDSIPHMYIQLRDQAINNYGYENDGMSQTYADNMIETVIHLAEYNYPNFDMVSTSSEDTIISQIDSGRPGLISTSGSETYNNHSMAVYGYRKYKYYTYFLGFIKVTNYAYFWVVDSGHRTEAYSSNFRNSNGDYLNWFDGNQSSTDFMYISTSSFILPSC